MCGMYDMKAEMYFQDQYFQNLFRENIPVYGHLKIQKKP